MIEFGIIREIDYLGHIAIPKEIMRRAGLNDGTPMEIFYKNDGTIVLKKYIPKPERIVENCGK